MSLEQARIRFCRSWNRCRKDNRWYWATQAVYRNALCMMKSAGIGSNAICNGPLLPFGWTFAEFCIYEKRCFRFLRSLKSQYLPAIKHLKFTLWAVNVTVTATYHLRSSFCTVGWAVFYLIARRSSTLLRHTKRNGHFKNVFATVSCSHFASTCIETSVGAASGSSYAPARFTTHSSALTVLAASSYLQHRMIIKLRKCCLLDGT